MKTTNEPLEILLVDDNEDDRLLIREALQQDGVVNVVHEAESGDQALAFLADEPRPGLVLLDINMPGLNGFEVLERLKADPTTRHIPVVVMTTSKSEEDVARSYEGGACSYVVKPVTIEQMREVAKHFSLYWTLVSRTPKR